MSDYTIAYRLLEEENAFLRSRVEELEAALQTGRKLVEAMDLKMPEQATEDADGFINSYRIPTGPWHRLLGWSRETSYAALHAQPTEGDHTI